jgi:ABC-2 type transport system permease protein
MVLFQFFGEVTTSSVTSLVARENLLRKMRFPRLAIPLSTLLTALMNLGATMLAVFVFAIASGVYPDWGWLELPVLVALLAALSTGAGMLLATLYVRYRDVQPIWEVGTQILFYASPILYVATMVPEDFQQAYMYNPIATVLTQMRHAVIDPGAPTAADVIGGAGWLLVPLAVTALVVALGAWVFTREAPRIAENL